MSEVNGKVKLSALIIAGMITANVAFASDAYKNNVSDVRVSGESGNAVKVTIYTDKPYTEPVVVNKKANNKYVILMPDTNSSLNSAPTVTNGAGTISNVTVNTQAVTGGKGYTKIIITSEKAINVVPRTIQSTSKVVSKPATTTTVLNTNAPVNTKNLASKTASSAKTQPAKQTKSTKTASTPKKPVNTQKPAVKPIQTTTPKIAQTPVKTVTPPKKEPIEILEQEIKTDKNAAIVRDKNDEILNNEIKENLIAKSTNKETAPEASAQKKTVIENIKTVLKDYQNISLWKLLLLAGAVTFPIIVVMIILAMDKKINKKIDKSFKREEETPVEYIPKEEYKPDMDSSEQTRASFNEALSNVEETISDINHHRESISEPVAQTEFNNDFVDDDFVHDFSSTDVAEPEIVGKEEEPEIPLEDTVITPLPEETVQEDIPQEPNLPVHVEEKMESYNPDGYLADFSEVNDKDFFDELAMQTMAANNADGLPEELPADEVFNFMSDDKAVEDIQPDNTVEPSVEDELPKVVNEEFAEPESDELTMLTEVKLNDSTGLYLVNYENFSSLVGHIKDDYFVIKKFDDKVSGKIIMKQAEKLKDATRYLVRVGKNKMVVEVSETSMSRLLDL